VLKIEAKTGKKINDDIGLILLVIYFMAGSMATGPGHSHLASSESPPEET
jgi:hypothetical protein